MKNFLFHYYFRVLLFACIPLHEVLAQSTHGNLPPPPSSYQLAPQYPRLRAPEHLYPTQKQNPISSQIPPQDIPVALSPKQGWNDLEKANIPEDAALWKRILIWPVNRVRDVFDIGAEAVDAVLGIFGFDISGDDLSP